MAFTTVDDGTTLYWEESGAGAPLLLIQRLGWSADMWYSLVPELARHNAPVLSDQQASVVAAAIDRWYGEAVGDVAQMDLTAYRSDG